ncbi:hypothetical protein glysoja_031791 [Glycine soja]|uniref:Uncharacterized protein n=1 Tax=Glycine soja TaxID=3848 RepID=A0A0B2SGI1_GLYSO|nr:hypothetical protein glysoja_031791 [Glycine soja]
MFILKERDTGASYVSILLPLSLPSLRTHSSSFLGISRFSFRQFVKSKDSHRIVRIIVHFFVCYWEQYFCFPDSSDWFCDSNGFSFLLILIARQRLKIWYLKSCYA